MLGWAAAKKRQSGTKSAGWVKQMNCGDGGLGRFLHLQCWMMMALNSQMGYYYQSGNWPLILFT